MLGCMKSSALLFLSKANKWPRGWTALLMKSSWKTQYLVLYMCLPLVVRTLSLPVHACHGCESFIQCRVLCPPWNWFSVSLFDIHTPSFLPAVRPLSGLLSDPIQLLLSPRSLHRKSLVFLGYAVLRFVSPGFWLLGYFPVLNHTLCIRSDSPGRYSNVTCMYIIYITTWELLH